VKDFLDERKLVTTRLRVGKPRFVEVSVRVTIVLKPLGAVVDRVKRTLEEEIRRLVHPTQGGAARSGWPFGRSLHKSDLFRVIEGIDGVDYVDEVLIYDEDLKRSTDHLKLREDELIHVVNVEVRDVQREKLA
jgi:hypothetical protein